MFYRSKIERSLPLVICGFFLIIFACPTSIYGQTDEIISRFLLNESEMIGYKLKDQFRNDWIVGDGNLLHKSIRQTWISVRAENSKEISVEICVFNSIAEAISSTAYSSGTYSAFFVWGSASGAIVGDHSWINAGDVGNTAIFVRGNVGAHIGFPLAKEDERADLETIAYKVQKKIEENLSHEVLSAEEAIRQKRGTLKEYQTIIEPVINSVFMSGFTLHSEWNSKWLIESESLTMGIRKEWKNEQGAIIGIDICKFDSDSLALKAINNQSRITHSSVFNLNDIDSLKSILTKWQNMRQYGLQKKLASVVGANGDIAVLIYQFAPTGIDIDSFYSIIEEISKQILNF